ncbi:hypothetical protein [Gottfriedia luciferensis]|uniref:hypothetical protein n=1 Tax=Gottfriedia luciferensis TaxID=178774 RepID=UPI000B454A2C|nr:hypothetical protein [Gottfriedia luciferensis]
MSSHKTTNLELHKWVGSDPFNRNEIVENFDIIDKYISDNSFNIDLLKNSSINIEAFGAKGNANYYNVSNGKWYEDANYTILAKDNTETIQSAIDYIAKNFPSNGATLEIPNGAFLFNQVKIYSKHIKVIGGGILRGRVLIQSTDILNPIAFNIKELFTVFDGVKFERESGYKGAAITIQNTRDVTIQNCFISNYQIGILGNPTLVEYKWQQTARIRIKGCTIQKTQYAVKTNMFPWDKKLSNWNYFQHGDWNVSDNYFYGDVGGIDNVHFEGQDGLILKGNFFFHGTASGKSPDKRNNIFIKQSNFVIISDNNLFEAGTEAIRIEDFRILTIKDNNIGWCGQRIPSSGIFVETTDTGSTYSSCSANINNNNISVTTKHGIEVGYNPVRMKINDNSLFLLGSRAHYYGSNAITNAPCSVYINYSGKPFTSKDLIVVSGNFSDKPSNIKRGLKAGDFYFPKG